jgi:hypothetical protein
MTPTELQGIAHAVVRRAQRQGYIIPREIREELRHAGLSEDLWSDVLTLARGTLSYRQGRYYHVGAVSPRLEEEQRQQRVIRRAVRQVMRRHRDDLAAQDERRQEERIEYSLPVRVWTADGRAFTLMGRDLSPTGIRLLGTRSLLGQRVRVQLPRGDKAEPWNLLVRVLWTCAIGDDLFENGGTFQEVIDDPPGHLKVVTSEDGQKEVSAS